MIHLANGMIEREGSSMMQGKKKMGTDQMKDRQHGRSEDEQNDKWFQNCGPFGPSGLEF